MSNVAVLAQWACRICWETMQSEEHGVWLTADAMFAACLHRRVPRAQAEQIIAGAIKDGLVRRDHRGEPEFLVSRCVFVRSSQ